MEVEVKVAPPMRVAYATYEGPLDRVGGTFHRIQGWALRQNVPPEPIIGVFVETEQPVDEEGNPHGSSLGTAEAWVEFEGEVDQEVEERFPDEIPVAVKDVPAVHVASVFYKGEPLALLRLQDQFRRFLEQQGFTLADESRHVYHKMDPDDHSAWETEVQVVLEAGPGIEPLV